MAEREKRGPPITLANMRKNGVHAVIAACQAYGHETDVKVDALPETIVVPNTTDRDVDVAGANTTEKTLRDFEEPLTGLKGSFDEGSEPTGAMPCYA